MEHRQHRSETRISRRRVLQASGALGAASALSTAGLALSPAERALAEEKPDAVKLNVLFIGAHPDDEAGTLAALGQWNEFHDVEVRSEERRVGKERRGQKQLQQRKKMKQQNGIRQWSGD